MTAAGTPRRVRRGGRARGYGPGAPAADGARAAPSRGPAGERGASRTCHVRPFTPGPAWHTRGVTRVIAGTAGGRRLRVPPGQGTRPTSDRAREGLFSSLLSELGGFGGLRVLDLYAGSGAVG